MPSSQENSPQAKRNIWPKFIVIGSIILLMIIIAMSLPRGFTQDTSKIGSGINTVVLLHDPHYVQSTETMRAMNEVRDEFKGRVEFIVSNINTPAGKAFISTYREKAPALVFFSGEGENLQVTYSPQVGASLRKQLNELFGY